MNPSIKELAKRPRGKPWASRLCAYEEEIRHRRKAHQSYREIARWLGEERSLAISAASVHAFVRARARRGKRRQYELPEPSGGDVCGVPAATLPAATTEAAGVSPTPTSQARRPAAVFVPKPARARKLTAEDLAAMEDLGEP